jgi:hypothetical protein
LGGAAFEVPQEIAQQMLERWQSDQPLTGEDAAQEYLEAGVGALALGGCWRRLGLPSALGLRLGLRLTNAAAVSILITFSIESAKEGVKVVCHGERKRFSVKKDEWFQEMRRGDARKIVYRSVSLTVKSSLPSYT